MIYEVGPPQHIFKNNASPLRPTLNWTRLETLRFITRKLKRFKFIDSEN